MNNAIRCIEDAFREIKAVAEDCGLGQTLHKAELGARQHERGHRRFANGERYTATVAQAARQLVIMWFRRYDLTPSEQPKGYWEARPDGLFEATQVAERLYYLGKYPDLLHTEWVDYTKHYVKSD